MLVAAHRLGIQLDMPWTAGPRWLHADACDTCDGWARFAEGGEARLPEDACPAYFRLDAA